MHFRASGFTKRKYYRSIFLSDLHMGAKSFDAAALLSFLNKVECKYLFLAGDIIDGWKLNKRWYWTKDCSLVIDALIKKREQGTKIIYLPGNHDDEIRNFMPLARNEMARRLGIKIRDKALHTLKDGRKFLILHGDQFDRKVLRGPLSKWGDGFYDWVLDRLGLHNKRPQVLVKGKLKPFSLAKSLNKHGQWALYLLNNFESAAYKMTQKYGAQGLICGHTHIPTIKTIKDITFANAGSWVNHSHTALVETDDGDLRIIDWPGSYEAPLLYDPTKQDSPSLVTFVNPQPEYKIQTNMIVKLLKQTWPVKEEKPSTALEWIEIQGRDRVTLQTTNLLECHSFLSPKRPINLATKIFLRSYDPTTLRNLANITHNL